MRPSRRWIERLADERGSASLEFIGTGVILLVPMVYLIVTMAALQAGALAIEGAARQAARVFVQADSISDASASADRAVLFALSDYGIDRSTATVAISCQPNPADCLTRRGFVTVEVTTRVTLPLVPSLLSLDVPLSVPLSATATQQVSRFQGAG